jgi:hypothetical protein
VTAGSQAGAAELYAIAVEMADRVSARRGQANQFYLTLQTLLLGAPALIGSVGECGAIEPTRGFLLALIGGIVSVTWWLQLRSYRDLNRAKFEVINKIEAENFAIKPFTEEWTSLRQDKIPIWKGRYAELGAVERVIPIVFLVLNVVLAVIVWV